VRCVFLAAHDSKQADAAPRRLSGRGHITVAVGTSLGAVLFSNRKRFFNSFGMLPLANVFSLMQKSSIEDRKQPSSESDRRDVLQASMLQCNSYLRHIVGMPLGAAFLLSFK